MKLTLFLLSFFFTLTNVSAQQTVGLFVNFDNAFPGYTLYSTTSEVVYLIDNCGHEVNSWQVSNRGYGPSYLLEDGELLKLSQTDNSPFNAGGGAGRLEKYSWEGGLLWTSDYATTDYVSHHDIFPMENGNILMIVWELKSDQATLDVGRETIPNNGLWAETVVEIKPIGSSDYEIVWKWDVFDHLVQDLDPTLDNYGIIENNPHLLDVNNGFVTSSDWLHFNSIDYNSELDQILLSSRSMNEIYIIDHSTTTEEAAGHTGGLSGKGGDILFRWGNPDNYNMGTIADQKLYGQHNARWVKGNLNTEGNITIFNNGAGIPEGIFYSAIVELEPVLEGYNYALENGTFLPSATTWEYKANPLESFYSARISSAQRLPNDHTFINQGIQGRLFEIDANGSLVWEYYNPVSTNGPLSQGSVTGNSDLFKAIKYDAENPIFEGKDLSSKGPIELDPIDYECSTSSTEEATLSQEFRYTNPVNDILNIWYYGDDIHRLEIYTSNGQRISDYKIKNTTEIDLHNLNPGMYIARINTQLFKFIKI